MNVKLSSPQERWYNDPDTTEERRPCMNPGCDGLVSGDDEYCRRCAMEIERAEEER